MVRLIIRMIELHLRCTSHCAVPCHRQPSTTPRAVGSVEPKASTFVVRLPYLPEYYLTFLPSLQTVLPIIIIIWLALPVRLDRADLTLAHVP